MPAVFEYPHIVQPREIDGQGHVNNVEYIRWMQDAAVAHSVAQGWSADRYKSEGAAWVARTHHIEYRKPAFEGDSIIVRTWVANFRKVLSLRKYRIVTAADDAVLAVAETDWAYLGIKHHVPRRIPPEVSGAFQVVAEADEPN